MSDELAPLGRSEKHRQTAQQAQQQRQQGCNGDQPAGRPPRGIFALQRPVGGQDLAADLDPQTLGIGGVDHAALKIALDLAQLIAIDAQIKGGGGIVRIVAPPHQRCRNRDGDDGDKCGADDPEHRFPRFSQPLDNRFGGI